MKPCLQVILVPRATLDIFSSSNIQNITFHNSMYTYDRKKRVDGVLGRCDHVVASVEIGPSGHKYAIAILMDNLAAAQPHCKIEWTVALLVVDADGSKERKKDNYGEDGIRHDISSKFCLFHSFNERSRRAFCIYWTTGAVERIVRKVALPLFCTVFTCMPSSVKTGHHSKRKQLPRFHTIAKI